MEEANLSFAATFAKEKAKESDDRNYLDDVKETYVLFLLINSSRLSGY